jgi:hypothetical protein
MIVDLAEILFRIFLKYKPIKYGTGHYKAPASRTSNPQLELTFGSFLYVAVRCAAVCNFTHFQNSRPNHYQLRATTPLFPIRHLA